MTNANTGKGFKIPVKATNAVHSDSQVKPEQLESSDLGGSTVWVEFQS